MMDDDGRQSRARKVVSFTISPEASDWIDALAGKLRASRLWLSSYWCSTRRRSLDSARRRS